MMAKPARLRLTRRGRASPPIATFFAREDEGKWRGTSQRANQSADHGGERGAPGEQIIGEVQKGYKLGDRVLRPALVRVAKGKPASEAGQEGGPD
jgi:hypothetical protein